MLHVIVEKSNIEKALKILKGKVIKTKQLDKLRKRQQFQKKSVSHRSQLLKAKYVQNKKDSEKD
jgi:ribosomal protein S21